MIVEADVTLTDGKEVSYKYVHLFTLEDDMILKVKYITQNEEVIDLNE